MPYFKTETVYASNGIVDGTFKIRVSVDSTGSFYCTLPEIMEPMLRIEHHKSVVCKPRGDGTVKVSCKNYETMLHEIQRCLKIILTPDVHEEPVIIYNIKSQISFALTEAGVIRPSALYPDASWAGEGVYGDHTTVRPRNGGYSLTIGAKAVIKRTTMYGNSEQVDYRGSYYKDGDHMGTDNPAQKLNSWAGFTMGDDFEEIPYSDEAALFFHELLFGMARLSKRLQETLGDGSALEKAIASQTLLLKGD